MLYLYYVIFLIMKTLNIKFKHPLTGQFISLAQGTIDQNIIELEKTILVDPSLINTDYFVRTGKTFIDPARGTCEYIGLINPQSQEVINPEIGWIYIQPKPNFAQIDGYFGFFKNSHKGLELEIDGGHSQTSVLK